MQIWLTALARLPGAGLADVDDPRRVGLEHRARGVHRLGRAAAHDRELAVLGAGLPARDRRVEREHAAPSAPRPAIRRAIAGGDRGVVDEQRARRHRRQRAVVAEHDLGEVVVVADAGQHHVLAPRGLGRRRGAGDVEPCVPRAATPRRAPRCGCRR